MVFLLKAELTNNIDGKEEHNIYESLILVDFLKESGKNATIYDKELKMHFENPSALNKIYEVELHKIQLTLSDRLEKAEDLTRRLMYRYDWIQPKINSKNKVTGIENTEELRSTWKEIRKTVLEDYKGEVLLNYLDEIEHKMNNQDFKICPIAQYFFFGLIFLEIPRKYESNWTKSRIIELSEYEDEQFEEHISFEREVDDLRLYKIAGNTIGESKTTIHEYEGLVRIKDGDDFPSQVDVTVVYNQSGSILNKWTFNLEQY